MPEDRRAAGEHLAGTFHDPIIPAPGRAGNRAARTRSNQACSYGYDTARESLPAPAGRSAIIGAMSLAELLSGRSGLAGRLPQRLEELRGPVQGVIVLPRHLSWPGLRECDVSDDNIRRSMYGMVLTQGRRNDVLRFLNARLLTEDWPLIRASLDPKLRRWCERRFALRSSPEARQTPS
jgi:hypothetical protein